MQEIDVTARPAVPVATRTRLQRKIRTTWLPAYLCILPALIVIGVFSLFPVVYSLRLSFYRWDFIAPAPEFVGTRNFERIFSSEQFWQVMRNTLFFSVGSVVLIVCFALLLALLLDVKLRGIAFFRALYFIPHLTPMVAIATLWLFLYDPIDGLINQTLGAVGIAGPQWLQSTTWALPALIIMKAWKATGYYTVLFLAGLQHPFASELGWRYHEFDWALADLLEVWHIHEGPGNLLAQGLWDEQLRQGRRIVGVAATDSHDPHAPRHRLGGVLTAIYAPELSEAGLLAGLRSGRVYGTRGPRLELSAAPAGAPERRSFMGEQAPAGPLALRIELSRVEHPWHLHVLKNGYPHRLIEGPAGEPAPIELHDLGRPGDYYRLELHAFPPYTDFPYQRWREWHTMLAFSNPIFVGA